MKVELYTTWLQQWYGPSGGESGLTFPEVSGGREGRRTGARGAVRGREGADGGTSSVRSWTRGGRGGATAWRYRLFVKKNLLSCLKDCNVPVQMICDDAVICVRWARSGDSCLLSYSQLVQCWHNINWADIPVLSRIINSNNSVSVHDLHKT